MVGAENAPRRSLSGTSAASVSLAVESQRAVPGHQVALTTYSYLVD